MAWGDAFRSAWNKVADAARNAAPQVAEAFRTAQRRFSDAIAGASTTACSAVEPPSENKDRSDRQTAIQKSNMVPEHAEAFSRVAQDRDEVILVRPVNPDATKLIKNGAATKSMHIKGKSADWGPQAGYIPRDQKYSKIAKDPDLTEKQKNEKIEEYNHKNEHAIEAGIVTTVLVDGPNGEKIEVLAYPNPEGEPKPITADYDLLAIGSKEDELPVTFDPNMGNITELQKETVSDLNKAVKAKGYTGGNIVHHGAENNFPGSPGPDYPVTAFTPDGKILTLEDEQQLKKFFKQEQEKAYHLTANPTWGW